MISTRAAFVLVLTLSCTGASSPVGGRSGGSTGATAGSGGDDSSSSGGQGGSRTPGAGGAGASAGGTSGGSAGGSSGGAGIDAGEAADAGSGTSSNDGGSPDSGSSAGGAAGSDPLAAGWTPYDPPKKIQIETHDKTTSFPYTTTSMASEGGSYDRSDGIETFKLFNHDASNRVEVRVLDDYATGWRQFAGDVRFIAPTDNESMMQVFGETGGSSMLMLKGYAENGGTIAKEGGKVVLVTGVYGKWVHVNVIHDATNNKVSIYIDGQLKGNFPGKGVGPDRPFHYHKYGCYGTLMTESAQVQWRNIAYYLK